MHSVRQITYINIYLQSANEGVVDLTMANPPIAPDYDKYHNSTIFGLHRLKINSSLGQLHPSDTDMRKVATLHGPREANVQN
jgi:hypothetical protein